MNLAAALVVSLKRHRKENTSFCVDEEEEVTKEWINLNFKLWQLVSLLLANALTRSQSGFKSCRKLQLCVPQQTSQNFILTPFTATQRQNDSP